MNTEIIKHINDELRRLEAASVDAALDGSFEPEVGVLVHVEFDGASWHLLPEEFLSLLQELPDGAGNEAIRIAIEKDAKAVWHGPAPGDSREASP